MIRGTERSEEGAVFRLFRPSHNSTGDALPLSRARRFFVMAGLIRPLISGFTDRAGRGEKA